MSNSGGKLFITFKENMTALTKWSKESYGDIFKQLIIREDTVRIKEKLFEELSSKCFE